MHLVGPPFHPVEEPADTVPAATFPNFFCGLIGARIALDHPVLIRFGQLLEGDMNLDFPSRRTLEQVALAFLHTASLKRLDHTIGQAQTPIRHSAVQIDPNRAPKSTAIRACAQWIVE